MLESLLLVSLVIIVLWLATYLYYVRVSGQQRAIIDELDALKSELGGFDQEE